MSTLLKPGTLSSAELDSIVRPNSSDRPKREHPTIVASYQWQFLFSYYNCRLFQDRLPECMITLMRHRTAHGWFFPSRFIHADGRRCHEIALNTTFLTIFGDQECHQTLVHEMVHLEQEESGPWPRGKKPKRGGYHNRDWGALMERVGLCPSHTGKPGGNKTGHQMMEYVIEGGPFDLAFRELEISGFELSWRDDVEINITGVDGDGAATVSGLSAKPKPPSSKTKFSCPKCSLNAWAKPTARLTCTDCCLPMASEQTSPNRPAAPEPTSQFLTVSDKED